MNSLFLTLKKEFAAIPISEQKIREFTYVVGGGASKNR